MKRRRRGRRSEEEKEDEDEDEEAKNFGAHPIIARWQATQVHKVVYWVHMLRVNAEHEKDSILMTTSTFQISKIIKEFGG